MSNAFRNMINNNSRDWNATSSARENLVALVTTGTAGVNRRNSVTIRRDPDPSRATIYMLDQIIRQGVSSQQRRFTMTIRGTRNDGTSSTLIRAIDPSNTDQILRIAGVMAYASSIGDQNLMVDAGADTTDASTSSDDEVLNYLRINDVSSITITALPTYSPNTEDTNDNDPDELPVPSGPRRSRRIAASRLVGPGSSNGGFFRYWLDETFPESLKHLQVYKESEHKEMVEGMLKNIDGEAFEVGCLAHSLISLGLPTSKIYTLFEFISGSINPVFPASKLSPLAATLGINLQVAFYNKDHQTRGRTVKKYFFDPSPTGKIYYLGKIENHYIDDTESNWYLKAIRYYIRNKKDGGTRFNLLPLAKQQRVVKVEVGKSIKFRYAPDNEPKATNGELLAVLTYGYEGYSAFSNQAGKVSYQKPLVTPMNIAAICMRAELYHLFQNDFQKRDLPHFESEEEAKKFVNRSSKPMSPKPLSYLKHPPFSFSEDFGEPIYSSSSSSFVQPHPSYDKVTRLVHEYGYVKQFPWTFNNRYTTPVHIPRRGKIPSFTVNVCHKYTFIAIDSETCICEGFDNIYQNEMSEEEDIDVDDDDDDVPAAKKEKKKDIRSHRPYMFCLSYLADVRTGKPVDMNEFQAMMDDPNVMIHRDMSKPATFFNLAMTLFGGSITIKNKVFLGYDCAIQMTKFLGSSLFKDHHLHLLAHNARYDLNMWVKNSNVTIDEGIFKTSSRMNLAKLTIPFFPNNAYEEMTKTPTFTELTRPVYLQCTLAATGIPLSAFGKSFDLPIEKEYMPYSFYTHSLLFKDYEGGLFPSPDLFHSVHVMNDVNEKGENVCQAAGASTDEEFFQSVSKAHAWVDGEDYHMNLWKYAEYYCVRDCDVLLMGFMNFRFELYRMRIPVPELQDSPERSWPMALLLIEHAVSLPQYASYYFGRCGVFDGVKKFNGPLIEMMRRGVVGGKTMLAANCPTSYVSGEPIPAEEVYFDYAKDAPMCTTDIINEWMKNRQETYEKQGNVLHRSPMSYLDVGSLYPAAMAEIADNYGGFPMGDPVVISFNKGTYQLPHEVSESHFFMVSANVHKLGRPLLFPIVSGPASVFRSNFVDHREDSSQQFIESPEDAIRAMFAGNESRLFTNHPEGANLVLDKFTLEDIIEFHNGAMIEYRQALYWPKTAQGGNTRIGDVIKYLYNSRAKLVKEGKSAAGNARKLTMNAGYGRFLMKPPSTNLHFIQGKEDVVRYVARHSNSVTNAELIRPDFATVERRKSVEKFSNSTHLGAMILGVSKRIMNRVMVLCDKMFFRPSLWYPPMFYMDTDSIHMQEEFVLPLFKAYTQIYGKKVLVTPGTTTPYSHDAKWLGRFNPDFDAVKDHTEPKAVCSIFIAKKVYLDMLNLWPLAIPENQRTLDNTTMKLYFRMKGVPESVVNGLCRDYHREEGILVNLNTVFDLYQYLFMGEGFVFDLAKYSTRFEMGKNFSTSTKVGFSRSVSMDHKQILSSLYDWVRNGWGLENFYLLRHRESMYQTIETKCFDEATYRNIPGLEVLREHREMVEDKGHRNFISHDDVMCDINSGDGVQKKISVCYRWGDDLSASTTPTFVDDDQQEEEEPPLVFDDDDTISMDVLFTRDHLGHEYPPIPDLLSPTPLSLSDLYLDDENARLSFTDPPFPPEPLTQEPENPPISSSYSIHDDDDDLPPLNQTMDLDLCCECLLCDDCENNAFRVGTTSEISCRSCREGIHVRNCECDLCNGTCPGRRIELEDRSKKQGYQNTGKMCSECFVGMHIGNRNK